MLLSPDGPVAMRRTATLVLAVGLLVAAVATVPAAGAPTSAQPIAADAAPNGTTHHTVAPANAGTVAVDAGTVVVSDVDPSTPLEDPWDCDDPLTDPCEMEVDTDGINSSSGGDDGFDVNIDDSGYGSADVDGLDGQ